MTRNFPKVRKFVNLTHSDFSNNSKANDGKNKAFARLQQETQCRWEGSTS